MQLCSCNKTKIKKVKEKLTGKTPWTCVKEAKEQDDKKTSHLLLSYNFISGIKMTSSKMANVLQNIRKIKKNANNPENNDN